MSRDELRETFFLECEDLMEVLMSGLSAMDDGSGDDETINAVFRAVHSIKGGAGAFACDELVAFAHVFETSLDEVRGGRLDLDREVMAVFFRAADGLSDLTTASRDGTAALEGPIQTVLDELKALLGDGAEDEEVDEAFEPLTLALDMDFGGDLGADMGLDIDAQAVPDTDLGREPRDDVPSGPSERQVEIRFTPARAFYSRGNDSTLLMRALAQLGPCSVTCDQAPLPDLQGLDAEQAYCGWTITLTSAAPEEDILEIFEFAADDCELCVVELGVDGIADEEHAAPSDTGPEPHTNASEDAPENLSPDTSPAVLSPTSAARTEAPLETAGQAASARSAGGDPTPQATNPWRPRCPDAVRAPVPVCAGQAASDDPCRSGTGSNA